MLIGVKKTAVIGLILCLAAVIITLLPVFRWWGPVYLSLIIIADLVIIAAALKGLHTDDPAVLRRSKATSLLKYGMFISLVVFIGSAVFLG